MDFKKDFPIFKEEDISYLDTAATSQKPEEIIEKVVEYYEKYNGNPGRGSHKLAIESQKKLDESRNKVQKFLNAKKQEEIIFTKSTTESINVIAYSWGLEFIDEGDEILLCISNHHANIVPWQMVAKKKKAILKYVYLKENGEIDLDDLSDKLSIKTKLVSFSSVVNVTGVINPMKEIIKLSHDVGAKVLVDAAQALLHFKIDVQLEDIDFLVFSGHKLFSTMGTGVLYGKEELLNNMPPFIYGGDMIEFVEEQESTFAPLPNKFEGGTQNIGGIYALGNSIDYIQKIGYETINKIEKELSDYAIEKMEELGFIEMYHIKNNNKTGIISFNVNGVHSHDVSFILDSYNVFVRSGHHCAQPLMKYLNIPSSCRVSFSIYNTKNDIDRLIEGLIKVKEIFNL